VRACGGVAAGEERSEGMDVDVTDEAGVKYAAREERADCIELRRPACSNHECRDGQATINVRGRGLRR
jgi:hypothetical protein